MNQTSNYQLNQWQLHDRVMMQDFNADNAKIDAALHALDTAVDAKADQTALTALQTTVNQVSNRAGAKLITSGTVPSDTQTFRIPLTGVDWSQWKAVHLTAYLKGASVVSIGTAANSVQGSLSGSHAHLLFYPMFDKEHAAVALQISNSSFISFQRLFKDLPELWLVVYNSNIIKAGTYYKIWGEK